MLDEATRDNVFAEIMSRLTMMPDELDYEINVPGTAGASLMIKGGGAISTFTLSPVWTDEGGQRREGPAVLFSCEETPEGKITIHANEGIEILDWLQEEPWKKL